ncbi:hypothetical protein FNV43_RR25354 [Rhamnella rubrinervis]|uniref:Sulfotransferase n=1 Tax=Rhamnella rubrinervis TaxID=2594499 RepID=A0A8K0DSZ8_9ROSA|nr:hypothetical protein FNV43_RR25354 [Rhamnella rubrinervis]
MSEETKIVIDSHEQLLLSLPKTNGWLGDIYLYQGFWCPSKILTNIISLQKHYQAHDQHILLASTPKSGLTWLKALVFSITNRVTYTLSATPLLTSNPHELVPFLEFTLYAHNKIPEINSTSDISLSPRLFSTHIPYVSLPESVKHSNCRVIYICRNPFDSLVSFWHFATGEGRLKYTMEEYAEKFCEGEVGFGPFWDHILGFWKESLEKPEKVLFLKYENLKEDPVFHVKKLAEFVGFPFSLEEEKQGVVEEIIKLCSLKNLKELEVNKNGKFMPNFRNKSYFRKGEVGDWVNHLSPSMVERLKKVMQEKLSNSGLTFKAVLC